MAKGARVMYIPPFPINLTNSEPKLIKSTGQPEGDLVMETKYIQVTLGNRTYSFTQGVLRNLLSQITPQRLLACAEYVTETTTKTKVLKDRLNGVTSAK
jgi:hypothetical protein